jgi:hypothetical protein
MLFYSPTDIVYENNFKVLDEKFFKKNKHIDYREIEFDLSD